MTIIGRIVRSIRRLVDRSVPICYPEVFGSSEKVWNGFMTFEEDFAGLSMILRGFEGPGGVQESSGRVPRDVFRAFWSF